MFHNDVLRRIRYALAINDTAAISIFKLVDYDMDIGYLHSIMKKEDEEGYLPCRDKILALFLDGLIIKNRGKQEGQSPKTLGPKERLSNNEILRKIRIAMSYKDEDMINISLPPGAPQLHAIQNKGYPLPHTESDGLFTTLYLLLVLVAVFCGFLTALLFEANAF